MFLMRDIPRLDLGLEVEAPGGARTRWRDSDPDPAKVPDGLSFSSTMPGGFESLSCALRRKPGFEYADLERMSTVRVLGPGGELAWEGRLERSPRESGDQSSIGPEAVGWQAHLEDDQSACEIYVDRDMGNWEDMSSGRTRALLNNSWGTNAGSAQPNLVTGTPELKLSIMGAFAVINFCEMWYDAGPGLKLSAIYDDFASPTGPWANPTANWNNFIEQGNLDDGSDIAAASGNLSNGFKAYTTLTKRYAILALWYGTGGGTEGQEYANYHRQVAVYGSSGVPRRGSTDPQGVYASDVIDNVLGRWAPKLKRTVSGSDRTIDPTSFVIPHLSARTPTTPLDLLNQANAYHLNDWAVWGDRTFYYHQRGARGRKWLLRAGESNLQETGPTVDRLYDAVIVSWTDPSGVNLTIGPPGSPCDVTDSSLRDRDPTNPLNEAGVLRMPPVLDMGRVSDATSALQVGQLFLAGAKEVDGSGSATVNGVAMDDRGILRPAWQIRAGDQAAFINASDRSYRRVVRASHDYSSRGTQLDLDAPPEGMDALLERLGAVLYEYPPGTYITPRRETYAEMVRDRYRK